MREFIVDQPFLIVLKQRAATHPYFVAWVENIDLLEP
jgi:serine protease inhibitor